MRQTEKHEWTNGKKRQTVGCDHSVLHTVSLSLSRWQVRQQWGTLNSSVHTAAHRGFTHWQTEPRAVLSTACHSLRCSPPFCFLHLYGHRRHFVCRISVGMTACTSSKQSENESWDVCTRFENFFFFFSLTAERDTREICMSVTDWFLIFETWMCQRCAVKAIQESVTNCPVTVRCQMSQWEEGLIHLYSSFPSGNL